MFVRSFQEAEQDISRNIFQKLNNRDNGKIGMNIS